MTTVEQFFATARERYEIKLRRDQGTRQPWTTNEIFRIWRFCNVHREHDRTTRWFAENIREPLSQRGDCIKIVHATTIFRWFNRIETAEQIKDLLLDNWDRQEAKRRLQMVTPLVTGAYIIKGPDGFSKLDGILKCIDMALPRITEYVENWGSTLEGAWEDLIKIFYLGGFMSYEIVSDLRWTPVLNEASDIETWANAGPGCARGLGWIFYSQGHFNSNKKSDQEEMLLLMRKLLEYSRDDYYWPRQWKLWEMREVEHWLCEFDKYKRAERGEKLKRKYI